MKKIDLNVDIGEGFPYDRELLRLATSANVCCGEHAGSWELTLETIELCEEAGVRIGMHPGFPDREGFGRRMPQEEPEYQTINHLGTRLASSHEPSDWRQSIYDQVARFQKAHRAAYLKPHGAWYNMLSVWGDPSAYAISTVVVACQDQDLPAMVLPQTAELYKSMPVTFIKEGFAERRLDDSYAPIPRDRPGALLTDRDEIGAQALRLAPMCDSLCIHGDSPDCVETLAHVRKTLEAAGYEIGF